MTEIEYITARLGTLEILCQLAEEASELAQAALKLRRVLDKTNPTPVDFNAAYDNLLEEIADVEGAVKVLTLDRKKEEIAKISSDKITRWVQRLKDAENTNCAAVAPTVAPTDTPTEHSWISIEDRLPEDARERVLVKLGKSNHDIGDPKVDTDRYTVGCTGELCWARWGKLVTHWMPLPESAKEGANE